LTRALFLGYEYLYHVRCNLQLCASCPASTEAMSKEELI
jgi:hypothetical protein